MKRRAAGPDEVGAEVLARLRLICLALPATTERTSWGHPNFCVSNCAFVTFEPVAGLPSIAFRMAPDEVREYLAVPGFFATPYGKGKWVSLGVDRRINWRRITMLARRAHALVAAEAAGPK